MNHMSYAGTLPYRSVPLRKEWSDSVTWRALTGCSAVPKPIPTTCDGPNWGEREHGEWGGGGKRTIGLPAVGAERDTRAVA